MTATRRLVAIFYADVAGYSRLTGTDEEGTHRRVMALLDDATARIGAAGGTVLRYAGDAILATFPSVVLAVETSAAIQTALAEGQAEVADDARVAIRIGIHPGDVIEDRGEVFGEGVNLAARLEAAAEPGGICISGAAHEQVAGKASVVFRDGGEQSFRNIARPVRIHLWSPQAQGGPAAVPSTLALPDKPSVAVLPFTNMSGDPEQEFFSDGISEDIITELSRFRSLFVIARNSSFTFKGQAVDVKEVGTRLGVAYVLEGSVRKAGSRVRITAQLIEAATGNHLWAERYDRDLEDIFAVQDEVVMAIVTALEPQLGSVERQRARRRPAEGMDAWESLQRGFWHLYGSQGQPDELDQAVSFMEQAVQRGPTFAAAHAGLAFTLYYRWLFGVAADPAGDERRAFDAARKAVQLDPDDPFGHVALGRVHVMRAEHEAAIADARRAIALNPNYATAYFGLAHALWHAGRAAEALPHYDMMIRLSPRDPLMWAFLASQAIALGLVGRAEEALEAARAAQRQPGATIYANIGELAALGHLGRPREAADALARARQLKPDLSLALIRRTLPISDPEVMERFQDTLRNAGVPESA